MLSIGPLGRTAVRLANPAAVLALLLIVFQLPDAARGAGADNFCLVLRDNKSVQLLKIPVKNKSSFAIRYIHSVAQTPVTDYFVIRDGAIWLDRTVYHDFGAGLPHQPEAGQKMFRKNGELVISGYNKRLPGFALRVGRVANHLLIPPRAANQQDEEIRLDGIAPPGSVINFAAEPCEP